MNTRWAIAAIVAPLGLGATGFGATGFAAAGQEAGDPVRVVVETGMGSFELEVDIDAAPTTAANFLRYVDGGFYDGGTFFRTVHADNQPDDSIRIAVVQGGRNPDLEAESFPPIPLERTSETGLRHVDGAISMGRSGPDTATHSFFICIGDQPSLDFGGLRNPDGQGFAAFGRVVAGMDVVLAIHRAPYEAQRLTPPVRITRVYRAQTEPPAEPPADWEATAIDYSNVPYPHPVSYLEVEVYGNDYRLAYMDVAPAGPPNGRTVVLFHGMNFFAAGFRPTIEALRNEGFRVIAIDRLGFGRSSKPIIHYNLHIPARNAKRLLDALGIERAAIVGHSMGGMVATRFASTYPETTTHVVMVNQIGLTDSRPGRAWTDPAETYESVLNGTTYESVLRGHMRYYPNGWRPEYLEWVKVQYGLTLSGDWPRMARVRAAQRAILYEDPVVYEWRHIATKALVIGGAEDRLVADYPALARNVAEELRNAELVIFPEVGHSPQFEIPEVFHAELVRFLRSDPDEPADQAWRDTDVGRTPGS